MVSAADHAHLRLVVVVAGGRGQLVEADDLLAGELDRVGGDCLNLLRAAQVVLEIRAGEPRVGGAEVTGVNWSVELIVPVRNVPAESRRPSRRRVRAAANLAATTTWSRRPARARPSSSSLV